MHIYTKMCIKHTYHGTVLNFNMVLSIYNSIVL